MRSSTSADPRDLFPFLDEDPSYDNPQKRENYARLAAARAAQRLETGCGPIWIRLEPHALCNLRCCWAQRSPHHPGLRPRGAMTLDLAREIVDQTRDTAYKAILCHWGEPTLNRALPDIVRLFEQARIFTAFDSNMMLVTPDVARRLVEAGLGAISASIDGISQSAYEAYRKGGSVEKALAGLRNILEARAAFGRARKPLVRWQFLVFEHNVHEVETARRMARELGVDCFDAFGGGARQWSVSEGFVTPRPPRRPSGPLCPDPWQYLAIDWDGAAYLCCKSFRAQDVIGSMTRSTIPQLFDGAGLRRARRVIRDGAWDPTDGPTPCTACRLVTDHVPQLAALGHTLTLEQPSTPLVQLSRPTDALVATGSDAPDAAEQPSPPPTADQRS